MKGFEIDTLSTNQEMIADQTFELAHQKGIIEALIFVAYEPIELADLAKAANLTKESVEKIIDDLNDDYTAGGRSFRIEEIGGGYRMFTLPEFHHYINRAVHKEKRLSLSQASLETLAVVAYKQPVTRPELERIRGVDCDGVLRNLTARGLIRIDGRSSAPGKPMLYSTTDYFLEFFGLASIDDLPPLPPIDKLKESLPKLKLIRKAEDSSGENIILNSDAQPEQAESVLSEINFDTDLAEKSPEIDAESEIQLNTES
jgi:segregation and condensation protein B